MKFASMRDITYFLNELIAHPPKKHNRLAYVAHILENLGSPQNQIPGVPVQPLLHPSLLIIIPQLYCPLWLHLLTFILYNKSKMKETIPPRIRLVNVTKKFGFGDAEIRALDNVISLNFYPIPYAELTNQRYRSIGLGVSGYHHALAKRHIKWESEEHLEFMDKVFETINRAAIIASSDLAKEKGSYKFFEGSDWETGAYFDKRDYNSAEWQKVRQTVARQGMRNAYLLAVAPTSSTSIIAGTTAGLDPIMKRFFLEEKKGSMLPRVAPELSDDTYWMYKSAYLINQKWSVRASGVRQRHIDQAQSMNLYITNDFTMRQVLDLYLLAWKSGVKTIYYVRSKSLEVEECESCAS